MSARIAGCLAMVLLAGAAPAGSHRVVHYQPGEETVPAVLSDDAGQVVASHCMTCHSLDYITTQPRGKGAQFWRDEGAKMINVYKAPVAPADADTIAATLNGKFGGPG